MATGDVFRPGPSFSATAGSGAAVSVQLKTTGTGAGAGPATVRLCTAASSALMYVKFGDDSSVTATSNDMALPGGVVEIFQLTANQTYMSVISSGSSNTVYATLGLGS